MGERARGETLTLESESGGGLLGQTLKQLFHEGRLNDSAKRARADPKIVLSTTTKATSATVPVEEHSSRSDGLMDALVKPLGGAKLTQSGAKSGKDGKGKGKDSSSSIKGKGSKGKGKDGKGKGKGKGKSDGKGKDGKGKDGKGKDGKGKDRKGKDGKGKDGKGKDGKGKGKSKKGKQ